LEDADSILHIFLGSDLRILLSGHLSQVVSEWRTSYLTAVWKVQTLTVKNGNIILKPFKVIQWIHWFIGGIWAIIWTPVLF